MKPQVAIARIAKLLTLAVVMCLLSAGAARAAGWTPADMDPISLTAWFDGADASTVLTNSSGGVTNWLDKSGHGSHLNATNPSAPTVQSAGLAGRNVVDFNRNSINRTSWVPKNNNESFAIIVWNSDQNADSEGTAGGIRLAHLMLNGTDQRLHCGFYTTSNVKCLLGAVGSALYSTKTYSQNTWILFGYGRNTQVGQIWWNGALDVEQAVTVGGGAVTGQWLQFGGDASGYLDGQIAEIVVFSSIPSTPDRQLVEGYLAHKWSLHANLPGSHPFRFNAPVQHTSFTFDFEHPDGTGSAYADAIRLDTVGAIVDTNGVPIGFTTNATTGSSAQELDIELTPGGLFLDTTHAPGNNFARSISLGIPFATDGGTGVVSITARFAGDFTDLDQNWEMMGICIDHAGENGIQSHSLINAFLNNVMQRLTPDPWDSGYQNFPNNDPNVTELILSGSTTAGAALYGTVVVATKRDTLSTMDGSPGSSTNHLGRANQYAYLFATSSGPNPTTGVDGYSCTLKSITFRGPNVVVPALMPHGTVIMVR